MEQIEAAMNIHEPSTKATPAASRPTVTNSSAMTVPVNILDRVSPWLNNQLRLELH